MPQQNDNKAGSILASSFLHYPLMKYAFEGQSEQNRAMLLNKLYNRCVAASAKYGGVITTPDNLGTVIWLPGKNFPLSLPKEIVSGMAVIPLQLGIKATLRLVNHDGESEGWIKKHAAPNMGYIWCVGVLEEVRGKGYSRLLINQSMEQMREIGLTTCWLKTEDQKNVSIYQKLGFAVMNEMVVKSSGITSWAMMKEIV